MLKRFRQARGVEHGQVRFRCRSHVFQGVEETEVVLRDHRAAVETGAGHFQRRPNRVAGEEFVVARDPREFDHSEFHDQVVDEFLGFLFGQGAFF